MLNKIWLITVSIFMVLTLGDVSVFLTPTLQSLLYKVMPRYSSIAILHIAQRENIPIQALSIYTHHLTKYSLINRQFDQLGIIDSRPNGKIYIILVDASTNEIIDDLDTIADAEAHAFTAKYGKLEPALFEHLNKTKDNQLIPIMIWVAAKSDQLLPEREIVARNIVNSKHPEIQASALSTHGPSLNIRDTELARRINAETSILLDNDVT